MYSSIRTDPLSDASDALRSAGASSPSRWQMEIPREPPLSAGLTMTGYLTSPAVS